MLEADLRHVDIAEHLGVSLGKITRLQHITDFVELLPTFPAQADHELWHQFKTTTFRRCI